MCRIKKTIILSLPSHLNDKLIYAEPHVLINLPCRGYAIFTENTL